jgi:hypothetical protein
LCDAKTTWASLSFVGPVSWTSSSLSDPRQARASATVRGLSTTAHRPSTTVHGCGARQPGWAEETHRDRRSTLGSEGMQRVCVAAAIPFILWAAPGQEGRPRLGSGPTPGREQRSTPASPPSKPSRPRGPSSGAGRGLDRLRAAAAPLRRAGSDPDRAAGERPHPARELRRLFREPLPQKGRRIRPHKQLRHLRKRNHAARHDAPELATAPMLTWLEKMLRTN